MQLLLSSLELLALQTNFLSTKDSLSLEHYATNHPYTAGDANVQKAFKTYITKTLPY